jgi:hypothetical protein
MTDRGKRIKGIRLTERQKKKKNLKDADTKETSLPPVNFGGRFPEFKVYGHSGSYVGIFLSMKQERGRLCVLVVRRSYLKGKVAAPSLGNRD